MFGLPPSATSSSSFCSPCRFLRWAACRWPRPAIPDLRGILAGVAALSGSGERAYRIRDLVTRAALLPTRSSHNFAMRGEHSWRTRSGGSVIVANVETVKWLRTFQIYSVCVVLVLRFKNVLIDGWNCGLAASNWVFITLRNAQNPIYKELIGSWYWKHLNFEKPLKYH